MVSSVDRSLQLNLSFGLTNVIKQMFSNIIHRLKCVIYNQKLPRESLKIWDRVTDCKIRLRFRMFNELGEIVSNKHVSDPFVGSIFVYYKLKTCA